jgi:hypothetical protein
LSGLLVVLAACSADSAEPVPSDPVGAGGTESRGRASEAGTTAAGTSAGDRERIQGSLHEYVARQQAQPLGRVAHDGSALDATALDKSALKNATLEGGALTASALRAPNDVAKNLTPEVGGVNEASDAPERSSASTLFSLTSTGSTGLTGEFFATPVPVASSSASSYYDYRWPTAASYDSDKTTFWMTAGNSTNEGKDYMPWIQYTFGQVYSLGVMRVSNYNGGEYFRGAKDVEVLISQDGTTFTRYVRRGRRWARQLAWGMINSFDWLRARECVSRSIFWPVMAEWGSTGSS